MAIETIWVVVDHAGDNVAPLSLELLTKARALAGQVEGITWGDGSAYAAEAGAYGASALHSVGDLGGGLPGPAVASAMAAQIEAGNAPDAILVPHNYDGRDIAARLSVKIDRPLLTNVVGLDDGGGAGAGAGDGAGGGGGGGAGGGLQTEHAIFGGAETLTARFSGDGPGIYVVRTKSFVAEEGGGAPAAVDAWDVPDLGATNGAVVGERHVE